MLIEAGLSRGHQVEVLDTLQFDIHLCRNRSELLYQGRSLGPVDAVIPRIGASITSYGLAVVRQFELHGVYCVNGSKGIARSRDKLRALQLLSRHGIGMPPTISTRQAEHIPSCVERVEGPPVVVKVLQGTQGVGVVLAESQAAATSVVEAFHGLDQEILIQKFIHEAKGADIRALVVGNRVVAAMKRQALPGEFRSNMHRGGSAIAMELSREYRRAAVRAARVLGLRVAGVDLLESADGPMVMEVNSSPGLEGIEKTTGEDVAGAIFDELEESREHQSDPEAGRTQPVS
jgi:ribosomal protein S6--L-glutamate ligase